MKGESKKSVKQLEHEANELDYSSDESVLSVTLESDINCLHSHKVESPYETKIFATMEVEGTPLKVQIDSGATCNVLPEKFVPDGTSIEKSVEKLTMYSSDTMPVLGKCKLRMKNPKTQKGYKVPFVVVKGDKCVPLLGSRASQQMKFIEIKYENIANFVDDNSSVLINNENIGSEVSNLVQNVGLSEGDVLGTYDDVFHGLGHMPGIIHLETDSSMKPVVIPPRRIPIAIKPKLKDELERLEKLVCYRESN